MSFAKNNIKYLKKISNRIQLYIKRAIYHADIRIFSWPLRMVEYP